MTFVLFRTKWLSKNFDRNHFPIIAKVLKSQNICNKAGLRAGNSFSSLQRIKESLHGTQ
jgi:hypothetical protein